MRKAHLALAAASLTLAAGVPAGAQVGGLPPGNDERPNILVIITDDQATSLFNRAVMPGVFREIVDKGVNFKRAYVNTSQCCPSRSQILTGLYGHHTGVDKNRVNLLHPTFIDLLKDEGYRTMLVGKYLNSSPCTPRSEFDVFACLRTSKEHVSLMNPSLTINGREIRRRGYQTEILAKILKRKIRTTPDDQPFAAIYATTSPHMPANDDRYEHLKVSPRRPPNFDHANDPESSPAYLGRPALTREEIDRIDETYTKMTRATRALDDSLVKLLNGLGDRARNTVVFYLSDNGYMYGEHRLKKKVAPFEESVRVPFAVRIPRTIGLPGLPSESLVQNVDIAPTIAEIVGREWTVDGVSLLPVLTTPVTEVRDAALLENCQGERHPCFGTAPRGSGTIPSFWGVVTDRYKYVEYLTGQVHMYDLLADPFELEDLSNDPQQVTTRSSLAQRLTTLREPPPVRTTIVSGPRSVTPKRSVSFRYFSHWRDSTFTCSLVHNGIPGPREACEPFGQTFTDLAPGEYEFQVWARDPRGVEQTAPTTRSFTILEG